MQKRKEKVIYLKLKKNGEFIPIRGLTDVDFLNAKMKIQKRDSFKLKLIKWWWNTSHHVLGRSIIIRDRLGKVKNIIFMIVSVYLATLIPSLMAPIFKIKDFAGIIFFAFSTILFSFLFYYKFVWEFLKLDKIPKKFKWK
jgi:hypothetical protein